MKTVYVKDFVTLPCEDAFDGVRNAVEYAREVGADILQFEAGIYTFKSFTDVETDQTAHDAGAVYKPYKEVHLPILGFNDICIRGEADGDGNVLTVLEGLNDGQLHSTLPSVLWVDGGANITIENFKLRRDIPYVSAGRVSDKTPEGITVEVFEGNPCHDDMGTYCMNRFTPDGSALSGESLSYGNGLDSHFSLIGERLLHLSSEKVASMVEIGDIITFHQGAKTDFQCFFGNVSDLTLRNIHTVNANGFACLAFNINNLNVENVRFQPEGNGFFVAPRDAFKLHKCSGNITVKSMHVEGVRMDGQNIHSNFIFPVEVISKNTVKFFSRYAYLPLKNGSDIEFYNGGDMKKAKIVGWEHNGDTNNGRYFGHLYTVTFDKDITDCISEDTCCLAACWEPDIYVCTESSFKNIAGAGHLSRIDHMRISNCRYENMMNCGILLGAEFPIHVEGGNVTDAVISDCVFDNCGYSARMGVGGCIGITSYGFNGKNRDIHINNCTFKNSNVGIEVMDCEDICIEDCVFSSVDERIMIRDESCRCVQV